jgi:hypothetical protein
MTRIEFWCSHSALPNDTKGPWDLGYVEDLPPEFEAFDYPDRWREVLWENASESRNQRKQRTTEDGIRRLFEDPSIRKGQMPSGATVVRVQCRYCEQSAAFTEDDLTRLAESSSTRRVDISVGLQS